MSQAIFNQIVSQLEMLEVYSMKMRKMESHRKGDAIVLVKVFRNRLFGKCRWEEKVIEKGWFLFQKAGG